MANQDDTLSTGFTDDELALIARNEMDEDVFAERLLEVIKAAPADRKPMARLNVSFVP